MKQTELFDEGGEAGQYDSPEYYPCGVRGILYDPPPEDLQKIFELSADAYFAALHAQMSELPVKKEISRYVEKVAMAGNSREAAARAAFDRGDPDVLAVLRAAYKMETELHRLIGLLRFSPGPGGVYTARCGPDHFILPALAEHFTLRFREIPWEIIDEIRCLRLYRDSGGPVRLVPFSPDGPSGDFSREASAEVRNTKDSWEDLWRLYHRSVNNESRSNPQLQRRFMPGRYQKYLPELN